ncbi:hypothetical protein N7I30_21105 [Aurantimonas litoralis]|nr:hypothetical protein [Aurantimonas litoralis]
MNALPEELLELIRTEKERHDATQNPRLMLREYLDDLVEGYVRDDGFDLAGHWELWRMCGKLWNDSGRASRSLRLDVEELVRGPDRVPETYAQAARLVRWHLTLHKPLVRVAASCSIH